MFLKLAKYEFYVLRSGGSPKGDQRWFREDPTEWSINLSSATILFSCLLPYCKKHSQLSFVPCTILCLSRCFDYVHLFVQQHHKKHTLKQNTWTDKVFYKEQKTERFLFNQHLHMPHLRGGWNIVAKEEYLLTRTLTDLCLENKLYVCVYKAYIKTGARSFLSYLCWAQTYFVFNCCPTSSSLEIVTLLLHRITYLFSTSDLGISHVKVTAMIVGDASNMHFVKKKKQLYITKCLGNIHLFNLADRIHTITTD